jgi:carbon-monoxide dehydrogenase medium subunit
MIVEGPRGQREISAADFHVSFFETALAPDEVLLEVKVPRSVENRWGFEKLTKRAQDWAIVGAVASVNDEGVGVGLINMGPVPLRAREVEAALAGGASARDAAGRADANTDPSSDFNASSQYRRHLARVLVRRALEKAGVQ